MRSVRHDRVSRVVRRAAVVSAMALVAAAAPAQAQEPMLVGTAGRFCPRPQFATIAEALAVAPEGATVLVCPGIFRETVVVDRPLTLLGSERGVDARTRRPNRRTEAIVAADAGGFVVRPGVTGVTIDGFTVQAPAGVTAQGTGIEVLAGGARIVNNVIIGGGDGIVLRAGGSAPSTVANNRLWFNAGGIVVGGPAAVTISDNLVDGSAGTGILLAADTAGSTVSGNGVTGSGTLDCRDDSVGEGTAGTANTWIGNRGPSSSPTGLCEPS